MTVTLDCSSGTVTPSSAQASPGNPAVLTLNDFDWDGATCDAIESDLPSGYYQEGSTCDNLQIEVGGEASCTFTNAPSRATFAVRSEFDDDNPVPVDVTLSCNTGLPIEQTTSITDYSSTGDEVLFIVNDFLAGELDCDVTESVPAGYLASYDSNGNLDSGGGTACEYEAVSGGDEYLCLIRNDLQQVQVDVEKIWMDPNPEFNNPTFATSAPAGNGHSSYPSATDARPIYNSSPAYPASTY